MTDGVVRTERGSHAEGSSPGREANTSGLRDSSLARALLWALAAYALATTAAGAIVQHALWDARVLETSPVDYSWQMELPWRAMQGQISGRDFHFPMGPLWQGLAWLGALPGPFDPARASAGLQAIVQLIGVSGALLVAWTMSRSALGRAWVFAALSALAYGAGVATVRPMLSFGQVVSYLPSADDARAPRWADAWLSASLATLGLLLSFDRLLLACVAVAVMTAVELAVRFRRKRSPKIALVRALYYTAAQTCLLVGLGLLGWALGANPWEYLTEQRRIAASYTVNLARAGEFDATSVVAFVVCAVLIGIVSLAPRSERGLHGVWIAGALPLAAIALPQPNPGHVFLGIMPLVAVLVVIAAQRRPIERPVRGVAALLSVIFLFGWSGSHPESAWLSPRVFGQASRVMRGTLAGQPEFETDISRAARWARQYRTEQPGACLGLSPGLTAAHPLADVSGPTSLALRWNSQQKRSLGESIAQAACPAFVYQVGSFDRPDRPNWFLGEDLFVIHELYEPRERLGPATFVLGLRENPSPPKRDPLSSPLLGTTMEVTVPGELSIPLESALSDADFLWLDYSLQVARLPQMLGAAPEVHYRFEQGDGQALGEVPFSDVEVNRRAQTALALDPQNAEWAWATGRPVEAPKRATALRVRFAPRGRFSPRQVTFTLHGLQRWQPNSPPRVPASAQCATEVDLMAQIERGEAMPRSVALRPSTGRFLLHPTVKPEKPAEVFFPVRPCSASCLMMELGIEMPEGSGDGVTAEVHVIDGLTRPVILRQLVLPGQPPHQIELPLENWATRDILLRMGSETGQDTANDYLFVGRPQLARCTNRAILAERLRRNHAKSQGTVSPRGVADVLLDPQSELRYPMVVSSDTCVRFEASAEGTPGSRLEFALYVVVDGRRHRVDQRALSVDTPPLSVEHSLHDWFRRPVELLTVARKTSEPAASRIVLSNYRIGACNES